MNKKNLEIYKITDNVFNLKLDNGINITLKPDAQYMNWFYDIFSIDKNVPLKENTCFFAWKDGENISKIIIVNIITDIISVTIQKMDNFVSNLNIKDCKEETYNFLSTKDFYNFLDNENY